MTRLAQSWNKLLVLTLAALGALVTRAVYPRRLAAVTDPSFVDAIIANSLVVTALRFTLVYVAVFVVLSLAARVWQGQWLLRAGPSEVSEEQGVEQLTGAGEEVVAEDKIEIALLRERVRRADQLADHLRARARAAEQADSARHGKKRLWHRF